MTIRRFQLLHFLLVLVVLAAPINAAENLPVAAPEAVGFSGERLHRLTEAMQSYVDLIESLK